MFPTNTIFCLFQLEYFKADLREHVSLPVNTSVSLYTSLRDKGPFTFFNIATSLYPRKLEIIP